MSHFSRKKLRFLAPQFGPINTLWSKPRNRVLSFLFHASCPIWTKGFKSIAICYIRLLKTLSCVEGVGYFYCFVFIERAKGTWRGEEASSFLHSCARASSKFLLQPYNFQQGFGGRLASPSLLFSGLFNRFNWHSFKARAGLKDVKRKNVI